METPMFVKTKMDDMSKANPHLQDPDLQNIATEELSVEDDHLFPKVPPFSKIARLKGIENGTILLGIKAKFIRTAVCDDRCAVVCCKSQRFTVIREQIRHKITIL